MPMQPDLPPQPGEPQHHPTPGPGTMTLLPQGQAAPTGSAPTPATVSHPQRVGRFEVRRFVGEGAFGRVYEAFDPVLRRAVALKVAKPERLLGKDRGDRLLREAQAAAHLVHAHIVAVF